MDKPLALPRDSCLVFLSRLDSSAMDPSLVEHLVSSAVSPERRSRTERLRRTDDRARSAYAELLLNHALRRALRLDKPALGRTELGAPFVANAPGAHVSLSHSGSMVACVLSSLPVGLDVQEDTLPDLAELIPGACSPAEAARLASLDPPERLDLFLKIWTGKESAAKCLGVGLGLDFTAMELEFGHTGLTATARENAALTPRTLYLDFLEPGSGYTACVARAEPARPPELRSVAWRDLIPPELGD
ncbi:MAG: 4'-phosphopantetheinyl transferase superfamily protein [Spirochaetales bacterium]|nr:4'-phosphopantetheinyl transferase superfamily protein [Spirochaetales bacterium]